MIDKFSNRPISLYLLILVAALGLLAYLFISNTFSFKDRLFSYLYPKPQSQAAVQDAFEVTNAAGSPLPQPSANTFTTDSLDVQIKLKDINALIAQ